MKITPFLVASAAVLGTAAVLVGSGTAATSTSEQLMINQKISQAAVRRSNSALNYLAPIRTTTTDAANTGANGVTPLSKVTGSGLGWTTAQIANAAVTPAKLSNPSYFAVVSSIGAMQRATSGVTVTSALTGTSTYTVTFPSNVGTCAPVATVQTAATGAALNFGAFATVAPGAQNTQWVVTTYTGSDGTGKDAAGTGIGNQEPAAFNLVVQC
ncbi:MAG: hypothetical protein JHC53_07560 [Thermoleophilia bacterium]|nr:hypothetical protein [Thermoleophilia bacterium]